MIYDRELTLIKKAYTSDEHGVEVETETRVTVMCSDKDVSRSEFYTASTNDLKPSKVFSMHEFEYSKEKEVEFENELYKVIRTYRPNIDEIELTCEGIR